MAGKVTVGLASQWPCVRDFSGLSTYRLNAYSRGRRAARLHSSEEYGTAFILLLLLPFYGHYTGQSALAGTHGHELEDFVRAKFYCPHALADGN